MSECTHGPTEWWLKQKFLLSHSSPGLVWWLRASKSTRCPDSFYIVALPSLKHSPPPYHLQWLTALSTLHAARGGSEEERDTPSLQEMPGSGWLTLPSDSMDEHLVTWPHLPAWQMGNRIFILVPNQVSC